MAGCLNFVNVDYVFQACKVGASLFLVYMGVPQIVILAWLKLMTCLASTEISTTIHVSRYYTRCLVMVLTHSYNIMYHPEVYIIEMSRIKSQLEMRVQVTIQSILVTTDLVKALPNVMNLFYLHESETGHQRAWPLQMWCKVMMTSGQSVTLQQCHHLAHPKVIPHHLSRYVKMNQHLPMQ